MGSIKDRIGGRPLTIEELWNSWPVFSFDGDSFVVEQPLPTNARNDAIFNDNHVPGIYPKRRNDISLSSTNELKARHRIRLLKLQIINQILDQPPTSSYDSKTMYPSFSQVWSTLQKGGSRELRLNLNLERATIGAELAVKLFDQGKFEESLYESAMAWCQLLPYHIDAVSADTCNQVRIKMAIMENTIFRNIQTIATELSTHNDLPLNNDSSIGYAKLGYSAGLISLTLYFGMTVKDLLDTIDCLESLSSKILNTSPGPSAFILNNQTRSNIALLEKYAQGKSPDFTLSHLDPRLPLERINRSDKEKTRTRDLYDV